MNGQFWVWVALGFVAWSFVLTFIGLAFGRAAAKSRPLSPKVKRFLDEP